MMPWGAGTSARARRSAAPSGPVGWLSVPACAAPGPPPPRRRAHDATSSDGTSTSPLGAARPDLAGLGAAVGTLQNGAFIRRDEHPALGVRHDWIGRDRARGGAAGGRPRYRCLVGPCTSWTTALPLKSGHCTGCYIYPWNHWKGLFETYATKRLPGYCGPLRLS